MNILRKTTLIPTDLGKYMNAHYLQRSFEVENKLIEVQSLTWLCRKVKV